MQVEFDERGCKAFFKKHRHQQNAAETMIGAAITREVATGITKVKLATKKRVAGKPIYEFRGSWVLPGWRLLWNGIGALCTSSAVTSRRPPSAMNLVGWLRKL